MEYITTTEEELLTRKFSYRLANGAVTEGNIVNAGAKIQAEAHVSLQIMSNGIEVDEGCVPNVQFIKDSLIKVCNFYVHFPLEDVDIGVNGLSHEDIIELIKTVRENPYVDSASINRDRHIIHKIERRLSLEDEIDYLDSETITDITFDCSIGMWEMSAITMGG